jgi:hypothetical protein
MTAVSFSYTGLLKAAGWSDFVPESAPDSNGIYWWDITRNGVTLHGTAGSGYLSYNPSTGLFTFPEGTLLSDGEYWSFTDHSGLRVRFLKTAPFNGTPPTSGGGTSTEGQAALTEGFLAINNGVLEAFIPASTPSGNFWIVEGTIPRNGFTHTVLTNTFQTATGWSESNKSTWTLQDGYGAPLATWRGRKKVHCNFW